MLKALKNWLLQQNYLTLIAFILIFAMSACMNFGSDTWWLLRTGQDIFQQKSIITSDLYSWTNLNADWPNHEWLTQLLMYLIYSIGGLSLLVIVFALLVTLTWLIIYRISPTGSKLTLFLITLGIIDNINAWSIRPQIISFFLFISLIVLIRQPKLHWWIVPFMLVWANLHAGFVIGIVLLGLVGIAALIKREAIIHWLLIGTVSVIATLANPHGYKLWLFTLNSLDSSTYSFIEEWRSQSITSINSYPFFLLVGLVGVIWYRKRFKPSTSYDWFLLLATMLFGFMAFRSVRQSIFFDGLAVLCLAQMLAPKQAITVKSSKVEPIELGLVGITSIIAILLVFFVWNQRQPLLSEPILTALKQCPSNMYNSYDIGGELIWFLPQKPVFIDNRFDPYSRDFIQTNVAMENTGDYQAVFNQYTIGCAIVENKSRLAQALQRDGWQLQTNNLSYSVFYQP
ncbi:hypothetical protein Hgul01_01560 [Herpetosiphon gulosus]|uniref:Glycosyltransferase RgtA/B/C/D-like domain-containing protein n=2 Tax=Herpetosiphon gulosus TaxID=1973496 RepID=A0ABP9WX36_9CHLR